MSVAQVVIKTEKDVGGSYDTQTKLNILTLYAAESRDSVAKTTRTQPIAIPAAKLTTSIAAQTGSVEFLVKSEPLKPQVVEGSDKLQTAAETLGSESFLIYDLEKARVDARKCTHVQMLQNAHVALQNSHRKIIKAFSTLPAPSLTTTAKLYQTQTNTRTTTKPRIINVQLRKKHKLIDKTTTRSSTSAKNRLPDTKPIISKETSTKTNMMAVVPTTTASLSSSSQPSPAQLLTKTKTSELKVKCLCRLEKSTAITTANTRQLKIFFEKMFDETRKMSRRQQRDVKMSLLQAVSIAEEQHDAGQNCSKCCS